MKNNEKRMLDLKLIKRLLPYIYKQKILVIISFILIIISNFFTILQPYFIKFGIDENISKHDFTGLKNTAIMLMAVMTGAFVFQALFTYTVQFLGQKLLYSLRMDIFKKILFLDNKYYDNTPLGKPLTNLTNDVEAIRQFISEGIVSLVGDFLKVIFILAAMFYLNHHLALLTMLTLPLFVIATAFFRKSIRNGFDKVRKTNAEINTKLVETISGIREINLFGLKNESKNSFEKENKEYLNAYLQIVHSYALYFPILEIVSNISLVIIFLYIHTIVGTTVEVGVVFAFFSYINMFFRPLRQMAEKFNMFQSAMAASSRVFKTLDRQEEITSPENHILIPCNNSFKINFENVVFSYTGKETVLKDISFSINPNETTAIVGSTGSGKTTIINLINRLYDINSGTIKINNENIKKFKLQDLRQLIATVPQDAFLFSGTIADNISLYKPEITREKIEKAVQESFAYHLIDKMEQGLDQKIMEQGKKLSSGEKQLLAIARALVTEPKIVILDEATSNIDSATEKLIEKSISSLIKNRTSIIIAHRLSTIQKADKIIVLEKGQVAEIGTHKQLIKQNGIYQKLFKTQSYLLQ